MALVGIDEPSSGRAGSGRLFSAEAFEGFQANGAVGEVCLHFYDARGAEVRERRGSRPFGLDAARLRGIPRVVGIGGGS